MVFVTTVKTVERQNLVHFIFLGIFMTQKAGGRGELLKINPQNLTHYVDGICSVFSNKAKERVFKLRYV